jgi:hypothetical protein
LGCGGQPQHGKADVARRRLMAGERIGGKNHPETPLERLISLVRRSTSIYALCL